MSSTIKKESSATGKKPFMAFATNSTDLEVLKAFAISQDWPEDSVKQGNIDNATEYLKDNPSPQLLLVELPSAEEANVMLDALADVCDPETRVMTIGDINEYSFYCWLTDIGITSYVLKPLTQESLEAGFHKAMNDGATGGGRDKPPAKVVAVMGTRGGVGATTVALNLGGIMATSTKKNIALVDIDPQHGSISLSLDMEPSRSFRDALERPDRIDSLFIERVMNKPIPNLSILSAEESLIEEITIQENAGDMLVKELQDKFDYIILDIPRHLNSYARQCIKRADYVVMVTELTLLSLRDALRIGDLMREAFQKNPPIVVANNVGHVAKHEMKPADFEKGINNTVAYNIPYTPDVFMPISTEFPAVQSKSHASIKPLYELAGDIIPAIKKAVSSDKKGFHLFGGKKES